MKRFNPYIHNRRSIRLPDYDYASVGGYFVTICNHQKECLLGEVKDCRVVLNDYGNLVLDSWLWLEKQYPYVELGKFVIVPNHVHGVILITDSNQGGSRTAPTVKPLGRVIGAFKTFSSRRINALRHTPSWPVWQRNYYEHVLRAEEGLYVINKYIENNPLKWQEDEYYLSECRGDS